MQLHILLLKLTVMNIIVWEFRGKRAGFFTWFVIFSIYRHLAKGSTLHSQRKENRMTHVPKITNTSSEYHYKDTVLQYTPLLMRRTHEWMNLTSPDSYIKCNNIYSQNIFCITLTPLPGVKLPATWITLKGFNICTYLTYFYSCLFL